MDRNVIDALDATRDAPESNGIICVNCECWCNLDEWIEFQLNAYYAFNTTWFGIPPSRENAPDAALA